MLRLNSLSIAMGVRGGSPPTPPSQKTFGVTLSGITGATPSSISAVVTIDEVGMINPIVAVSRSSGVAPLAVTFDASATQIANTLSNFAFHDVYYAWTFDDENGSKWAYGNKAGVASKNTAYGPIAAHVFESAGTKNVTCWAYFLDSGGTLHSKSVTTTITVTAADTVFAANTLYVSSSSLPVAGSNGVPVGANVEQITSWALIGTRSATYKRIFLKRGDTWTTDGVAAFSAGPGLIGAYGTGNAPKVVISVNAAGVQFYTAPDWRVVDLEITSDLIESNTKIGAATDSANTLFLRCNIHDVQSGIQSSMYTNGLYIVDSVIEDMFTAPVEPGSHGGPCGFFDVTDRIAIMGCAIARSHGSHITRLQGTSRSVVQHNTYTTASGFTYNSLTIRGKTTDNGNPGVWNGLWSELNVVSDNVFDASLGGGFVVHSGPQSTGHAERVRDLIVERNMVIGGSLDAGNFTVTRLTVRTNLMSVLYVQAIGIGTGNAAGSPSPSDNFYYNNTLVKRAITSSAWFSAIVMNGGGQSNILIKNNLAYGPNTTKNALQSVNYPEFMTAYGGSTSANYTLDANTTDAQIAAVNPFSVAMPVLASEYAPTGYAVGSGVYVPVRTNYFNDIVTSPRNKGAI